MQRTTKDAPTPLFSVQNVNRATDTQSVFRHVKLTEKLERPAHALAANMHRKQEYLQRMEAQGAAMSPPRAASEFERLEQACLDIHERALEATKSVPFRKN